MVEPPLWKIWVKVSWDDFPFPTEWKVIKFMFQTTNQYIYIYPIDIHRLYIYIYIYILSYGISTIHPSKILKKYLHDIPCPVASRGVQVATHPAVLVAGEPPRGRRRSGRRWQSREQHRKVREVAQKVPWDALGWPPSEIFGFKCFKCPAQVFSA